jgi:regulatory protein
MRRQFEPTDDGRAAGDVDPDPEAVARAICLRLLTGAPRTRSELATALRKKGVPADVAEAVLDRYVEVNLIDDAAYADAYVESRHQQRGLARTALRNELRRKGVDAETAAAAVEQIDPADEEAAARALVARRLPATTSLTPEARLRRLTGMLARKGYPSGLSHRIVRAALAAEGLDIAVLDVDA